MRKTMSVVLMAAAVLAAACAGPVGKGEGEACSSADDCSSNLTCQPIQGRNGDFCCPTPASASHYTTCHTQ